MPRFELEAHSSQTPLLLPLGFLGQPQAERHTWTFSQVCRKYLRWVNCHHTEFGLFRRQPWNPNYCFQEFPLHGNHSVSRWNFIRWVFWAQWKGNYNGDPCMKEVQSSLAEISSHRWEYFWVHLRILLPLQAWLGVFVVLYINRREKKERSVVQRLAVRQSLMLGESCGVWACLLFLPFISQTGRL